MRDLLEQPLDFYEPDVLPAAQTITSNYYREPSGLVVFCFIDMVINNSVKAPKETVPLYKTVLTWYCTHISVHGVVAVV